MKNFASITILSLLLLAYGCNMPVPEKKQKKPAVKHNYIVLLDLSDRLIIQDNQPARDKEIVSEIYRSFEAKVKKELYVKSRDEIKVVIAPQRNSRLKKEDFEDRMYVNMNNIKKIFRRAKEKERRDSFMANLDTLYQKAVFSKKPEAYDGADIWKYFYEDLKVDYVKDTLTENFLFIVTDGYPIVGKNQVKLRDIKDKYPDLHIILVEASPREKDMEWDRIMVIWEDWFKKIGIEDYTMIKRGAISKEVEMIREILAEEKV